MTNALTDYKESGVSALYLMGVFERDNVPFTGPNILHNQDQTGKQYKKANASALAVTSRITPCEMLGG